MRVSILVNSADPTACHDYALLWLDPARRVWTRQACVGIALPTEGAIVDTGDATRLTDAIGQADALLTLGRFQLDAREQLTAILGTATWFSLTRHANVSGMWHLRAVERDPQTPGRRRAPGGGHARPPGHPPGASAHHECR
jgi:hypothetical protein